MRWRSWSFSKAPEAPSYRKSRSGMARDARRHACDLVVTLGWQDRRVFGFSKTFVRAALVMSAACLAAPAAIAQEPELCENSDGILVPSPLADECSSDATCPGVGVCVVPERTCVPSVCFCGPGSGWDCSDDCGGEEGLECRFPGDPLPRRHPLCAGQDPDKPCVYPRSSVPAPVFGGGPWALLLTLGAVGLALGRRG